MRIKLSSPFKISELISSIDVKAHALSKYDSVVCAICTDSRLIEVGDLFFALKGDRFDGEDFVTDAISNGAIAISKKMLDGVITVSDTSYALLSAAAFYKSRLKKLKYSVAITGSIGKSTTKEFVKKLASVKYCTHATHANYNNYIGLAHTVFSAPENTEVLVVELGMNHLGEISTLSKCISPDIAVITGIGTAHIGILGSRENIAKAKLEIVDGMNGGPLLIPYGEPLLRHKNAKSVSYSSSLSDFSLYESDNGTYCFDSPSVSVDSIATSITAEHLLFDLSLSLSVGCLIGLSPYEMRLGANMVNSNALRQRLIRLGSYSIFDDSYNSSYESVLANFRMLRNLGVKHVGAFLGDMLELGGESEKLHRMVGKAAYEHKLSSLYLLGKYAKHIANGAISAGFSADRIFINENTDAPDISVEQISENHLESELILFKGSHRLRLDRIADVLISKERKTQ